MARIQPQSNLWKRQLLGCWLGRSCRSTTLSQLNELGVNPANQFGNLPDNGFGNMQAAQPCGNRRSLSEGSEIFKLDGQNPASFQPVEVPASRLLARPILQEYDAFHVVTVQPCGNRSSVSEGSEILKLDSHESCLSPTCGSGNC